MKLRFLMFVFTLLCYAHAHAATTGFANQPDVKKFINHMVQQHHFKKADLVKTLNDVKIKHSVLHSIRAPLEQMSWHTYQRLFVTEWRIREGVEFWKKYRSTLARAEKTYGVPASIIVATIGVETKYGRNTGNYRVIDALANIAFSDSPRAKFFRKELEEFFLLAREEHLNPLKVMGSYAGAIGQPQFMPSSYRHYAVNFSGGKKIDLSHNEIDVIGSVANYYHKHGWEYNRPVAMPVSIKSSQYAFLSKRPELLRFSQYDLAKYGIPSDAINKKTKIIELENYFGNEYWLGFNNFNVIKRYNTSNLYAMAVYQLSHYIAQLKEKVDNV